MLPCMAALFGRGLGGERGGGEREKKSIVSLTELKDCLQLGWFSKVLCHRLAQS